MTTVRTITASEIRRHWREVLDTVIMERSDVAISCHGEIIAVPIPAKDYFELADELEDLKLARLADDLYEEYITSKVSTRAYERTTNDISEIDDAS